jgi:hypothetical protein
MIGRARHPAQDNRILILHADLEAIACLEAESLP